MSVARLVALCFAWLGGVSLAGCCRTEGEPVVEVCSRADVKCKLSGGQLGICARSVGKPSSQCTREPCPVELPTVPFTCTPQH